MSCSSSRDLTDASSSCGSMPSRRTMALAVPFDTLMNGPSAALKTASGRANSSAARTGRASTTFFGMSSPATMLSTVATARAMPSAMPSAVRAEKKGSSAGRITVASAGSATKPSTRETMVIPSCAPERWNDSRRWTWSAALAARFPSAASDSRRVRSMATTENSAATKNAVAATRARTASRPRAVPMGTSFAELLECQLGRPRRHGFATTHHPPSCSGWRLRSATPPLQPTGEGSASDEPDATAAGGCHQPGLAGTASPRHTIPRAAPAGACAAPPHRSSRPAREAPATSRTQPPQVVAINQASPARLRHDTPSPGLLRLAPVLAGPARTTPSPGLPSAPGPSTRAAPPGGCAASPAANVCTYGSWRHIGARATPSRGCAVPGEGSSVRRAGRNRRRWLP